MIAIVDVAREQLLGCEMFFLRKKWPHSSVVVNHVEQSHELVMFTHNCDIGAGRHFDIAI